MADLPENLFRNPVWHALHTIHRSLAVFAGDACSYRADVAPFAALAEPSVVAMQQLHSLLSSGEAVWLFGEDYPHIPELSVKGTLECFQMALPEKVTPVDPIIEMVQLSDVNAGEMLALTALAFPGFFRHRTCEMGSYYGVRSGSELIAMGGERLMLDGYAEISGVCTHPSHRGQSLASSLIWQLVRNHKRSGLVSWLHVSCVNDHAIALYTRMGFKVIRKVTLTQIWRKE
jgi:predicted GNAT family acetyltransferase